MLARDVADGSHCLVFSRHALVPFRFRDFSPFEHRLAGCIQNTSAILECYNSLQAVRLRRTYGGFIQQTPCQTWRSPSSSGEKKFPHLAFRAVAHTSSSHGPNLAFSSRNSGQGVAQSCFLLRKCTFMRSPSKKRLVQQAACYDLRDFVFCPHVSRAGLAG